MHAMATKVMGGAHVVPESNSPTYESCPGTKLRSSVWPYLIDVTLTPYANPCARHGPQPLTEPMRAKVMPTHARR
jgi:hypothetical protein